MKKQKESEPKEICKPQTELMRMANSERSIRDSCERRRETGGIHMHIFWCMTALSSFASAIESDRSVSGRGGNALRKSNLGILVWLQAARL